MSENRPDSRCVLLAYGDPNLRDEIARLLTGTGYEVATCEAGGAVAAAKAHQPAVILGAADAARKEPAEWIGALRGDPSTVAIPVILLGEREAEPRAREAKVDDYLQVPLGASDLIARISTHIELAQTRAELERLRREAARTEKVVRAAAITEERMRASESRFRGLVEQAPFSVQILDGSGKTLRVNRAWEELWGATPDQIGEYNILQDPQLEAHGVTALLRRAFGGEAVRIPPIEYDPDKTIPNVSRHKNPRRWVSAVAYPLKDEEGRVREVVLMHEDITARVQAETALRKSEERFAKAFQASPDGMALSRGSDGLIREANDSLLRLLGLPREEVIGGRSSELLLNGAEERDRAMDIVRREGRLRDFEVILCRRDGTERVILASAEPIEFEGETWLVSILRDITERKRAESALRESEQRFRRLADASLIGIISGSGEKISYANNEFLRIVGYTHEDVEAGRLTWPMITVPDYRARDEAAEKETRERGFWEPYEKEYFRRDGSRVPVLLGGALISTEPFTWICFVLDLTLRKQAERALHENEMRFHALMEGAPVAIGVSRRGVNLFVNAAYRHVFNIARPEEVIGRPIFEQIAPEDHERVRDFVQRRYAGESVTIAYEFTGLRTDGTRFPAEVTLAQVPLPDGIASMAFILDLTERKEAMAKLSAASRESQNARAELEAIVHTMSEGLLVADGTGQLTFMNPAALQMHGYMRVDEIRQHLSLFPDVIEARDENNAVVPLERWPLTRVLRGETFQSYELTLRRKDTGKAFVGSYSGAPIRGSDGGVRLAVVTLNDVTARRRAEEALASRLEEIQALMAVLPVGVVVAHDRECRTMSANPAAAALLRLGGVDNPSKTGPNAQRLPFRVCRDGRELTPEELPIQRAARTGVPERGADVQLVFDDGSVVTVHEYATPLFDEAGAIRGCLGVLVDITDRERAEQRRRESEERYRSLVSVVTDLPWVADAAGEFAAPQESWMAYTGQTWEEHRGMGWLNAMHPDDREAVRALWEQACRDKRAYRMEERIWHARSERYRHVVARATPVLNSSGAVREWVGALTDIDDQIRAKEMLENTVVRRTAELRESNEQLEAFVYSIAHDLRGPLRSMTGYSELLLDEHAAKLEAAGKHMLERIQASAEFMDRLLLDLLAYGRLGRGEMELGPVSIAKAWAAAVFQCSAEIEKTGATIEMQEASPLVQAHEATLGQVFANLLGNALKFVAPGVRPHVRCWAEGADARVRIWIEDNGLGIPPEHHDRIFRVFERVHGAQFAGTGIGLSIVRKGVERMGGTVGLESGPPTGSRFWIELPRAASG